jgi:hypothetical protein
MTDWLKNNASNLWSWAILIVASIIIFAVSRGTEFQQFGIGLLSACVTLLVVMAIFEVIWQIAMLAGFSRK